MPLGRQDSSLTSAIIAVALLAAVCLPGSVTVIGATPVPIGSQKQLFIDKHIIADTHGVFPVLNQPTKYKNNPVLELKPTQPVGGQELIIAQGSVIYDEEEKLFKMWYEGATYHWQNNVIAYAYSKDGIRWTLPKLGIIQYNGSKDNNIVVHTGKGEMAPGAFKDPHEKDPDKRYKMLYFARGNGSPIAAGFSPDGIHWTSVTKGSLIPDGDSLHPVLWDPKLQKYVAHSRFNAQTPNGLERQVLQNESDDFLNWSRYGIIMKADEADPPCHRQFYDMSWMIYDDVYVGFMSVYHVTESETALPTESWDDHVDVQLVFSRDNRNWVRAGNRQTFIPNSQRPGEYDHGVIYTMHRPMVVDDEIWIYYAAYSGLHWATRRNEIQGGTVALAKLRLDGFVSMNTGATGTLTTRPLVMSGDQLSINADAQFGSIRVEILDADGKPIAGFTKDDAVPADKDAIRQTVRWKQGTDVRPLAGKTISLRFYLDRCRLFAFQFLPNP
jgi:hypothetical protein